MGALSVTGLKTGTTSLDITAGTVTKSVPVRVAPAGLFPIMDNQLPTTVNGITFSQGALPGSIHVKGTSTAWTQIEADVTLEAGTYTLACTNGKGWTYGVRMRITGGDDSIISGPSDGAPKTGKLEAGAYDVNVFVANKQTVDVDLTPTLVKTK
ncbi:hypothetical protein BREU_1367 [Bifidobacterium reuteri DSM 23975]|uniref:Uncharacterized protein n=1 Tax=Bifidobacterium reuteri DSM 23975 TaxID=1437610 RepID=A0A087CSE8_9BIFI|nr:hypothetical protein [Bifidobacterium reuteri]KFI86198.1 hypothetical protein BREU_1367 [Bifidobacterium reuteri DSM 23975]